MVKLSHCAAGLSIFALVATSAAQAAPDSHYSGRWTVSEDKPVYSARGLFYKTIDVAQCGRDYCGVSVGPGGACGPTLFRFLDKSINSGNPLLGHGRWGNMRLNALISAFDGDGTKANQRGIEISLGNGYDFGERSGNMPKFNAMYRPLGAAHCMAR